MSLFAEVRFLLRITRAQGIMRRYFVVNGFDGALAMLGLTLGFYLSGEGDIDIILGTCLATAVALMMSGISSAYISEAAEKKKELHELEEAMVTDLDASAHARAARWVPWLVALVNGISPFSIALWIMLPLWLSRLGFGLPLAPLEAALVNAFVILFLLGVLLGRISGGFWLWSGFRTLSIAAVTSLFILLLLR